MRRIENHPILKVEKGKPVTFNFNGVSLIGHEGESIAAALHANGVRMLHESAVKHRPRGLFCAIGNCSSCMMRVNGRPNIRVCVEPLQAGMTVEPQFGLLPFDFEASNTGFIESDADAFGANVLVVGGGPAGMCAALEAAHHGASVILAERDGNLGGQLVKQTHKFFGSEKQQAGTRGILIAEQLKNQISESKNICVWLGASVLGRYPDKTMLVEYNGKAVSVSAKVVIIATGACEKNLVFPGNDLPGIYGAGAVQTLMNVEAIIPGKRVLMVGAGNIGLIVSYQLLQAGVGVAAVIEAAPNYGGYEVHALKLKRAGIPILTSHTVKYAYGKGRLEGAVIHKLDESWQSIPGTERDVSVDNICIAVGLSPLSELFFQCGCDMKFVPELGGYVPVIDSKQQTSREGIYAAGDSGGVEEASSAMLTGRIAGLSAACDLGFAKDDEARLVDYSGQLSQLRSGPHSRKIQKGLDKLTEGEAVPYGK